MSEQHNTPISETLSESEPAIPHDTTLTLMSETENALSPSKPARGRGKKSATGEHASPRKTTRKRAASNAAESVSLPLPISPAPSMPPAAPTPPAKTRRKKQPATDARPKGTKKKDTADQADSPPGTPSEEMAPSIEPKKKATSSTKRRSTKSRKKAATAPANDAAGYAGASSSAQAERGEKEVEPLEPDLDPTPVRPADTRPRASIVIEPDLDSSPFRFEPEVSPFTLEETHKRPALRIEQKPAPPSIDATQQPVAHSIEADLDVSPFEPGLDPTYKKSTTPGPALDIEPSEVHIDEFGNIVAEKEALNHTPTPVEPAVEDEPMTVAEYDEIATTLTIAEVFLETLLSPVDDMVGAGLAPARVTIPETPLPPTGIDESIPETPLPPADDMVGAPGLPPLLAPARVTIPETPLPPTGIDEGIPVAPEKVPLQVAQPRPVESRRIVRGALALVLLALFLSSSLLLWRDINDAHLYLYHINPLDGQIQAQQDLGGGYQNAAALTNPVLLQSSLLLGVANASTSQAELPQQILKLAGSGTSWRLAATLSTQLSAQTIHSTLSVTPNNLLVVAHAGGLQVMTADGQLLWQTAGQEPTLGAHAFAPAIDNTTVYTIKDAQHGVIATYDLLSGAIRWSQQLDDTLEYAPPLLLYGNMLFVAGDHSLYALNITTGIVLWKAAFPTRTLLIAYAAQPLLIAVGSTGLTAFDPQTGQPGWSFNGQPRAANPANGATLTAAQFYQAGLSNTNNVIYTTGIVWDAQQVQEQFWLFAVDASTGELRWSERIGTGFSSADAGRVFTPYVDAIKGLVLLEQVQADGSHTLTAYASGDGSQHWRIQLAGVTAAAPSPIQASNNSLSIFSVQTDTSTALRSWSWVRLLLLALAAASLLALLALWILPLRLWARSMRRMPHALAVPFKLLARLWGFSHLLFALTFAAALIGASVLTYTQLNHPQQYLNQVEASNGTAQWQHTLNMPATLTGIDSQGSLVIKDLGDHLHQLAALDSNGSQRWTTFSSEGLFSLPAISTQAGTLLVSLSGHTSLNYRYAPDDAAYAHPLDHLFVLYLLDRASGQVIWQSTVVRGDEQQDTTILGDDAQFIYVASRSTTQGNMVVQLIAVEKTSGAIAWRIFGPREQGNTAPSYGTLLTGGRFIYWQANNTLYALDTELGQIQWRRYIAEMNPAVSTLEDAQMAQDAGVLLVRRSNLYHALDLTSGNDRWTLEGLGSDIPQTPGGIVSDGNEFILYGNGSIEAVDATTQSVLWKHQNMVAVSDVTVSADGSLIYAIVSSNLDGSTQQQALVAFDAHTTTVHWTFQPGAQALFVYPGADALRQAHGMLFVTICLPANAATCGHQALYSIDEVTGTVHWKVQATRISNMQVTADGSTVAFQTSSSMWENLKARFGT